MNDFPDPFSSPVFDQEFHLANQLVAEELQQLQEGTIFSLLDDFRDNYDSGSGAVLSGFVESDKLASSVLCQVAECDSHAVNDCAHNFSTADQSGTSSSQRSRSVHRAEQLPHNGPSVVSGSERYSWSCVEHDHNYCGGPKQPMDSATEGVLPFATAEVDTSTEEENSDTGYETTSPLVTNVASTASIATSSSPSLPTTIVQGCGQYCGDPVALIESRIKHFVDSQQVNLTDEEKETLKAEGMPIPTTLPLTKVEEKALKAVRRKLRNKMAALESRKKKKEYVQALEDKVRQCTSENLRLQKRLESLESENRSLLSQLRDIQSLIARGAVKAVTNHKGAVLTVIVLCFAIVLGSWIPQKSNWNTSNDYTTTAVRSRVLLSVDTQHSFHNSNWLWYYLFGDDSTPLCHNDPKLPQYSCYALLDLYMTLTPDGAHQTSNDTHATALSPSA